MDITSVHNPRVKAWSELLTKKGRDKQRRYLLEGIHLTEEALRSGARLEAVLFSLERGFPYSLEPLMPAGLERIGVSEAVLARCSDTQTPQGVAAVALKPEPAAEALLEAADALVVAVDGVQDPGNLGTIIRTADAAGATGVVLGRGTADLHNPKTVRSTMGSLFHLPVVEAALPELLARAHGKGIQLLGTAMSAETTCYAADLSQPTWIIVGNEGSGVSAEAAQHVTRHVAIPMPGKAESLNVAMAAGILLFEAVRQRGYSKN